MKSMTYVGGSGQFIGLALGVASTLAAAGGWPGYHMESGEWDPWPVTTFKWFAVLGGAGAGWWRGQRPATTEQ